MKRKYLYNLISSLLIFIFVITPFLVSIPKAEAQATSYGTSGVQSNGISGYLGGVSQIIPQLPLCKNKLGGVVKSLFKKAKVTEIIDDSNSKTNSSEWDKTFDKFQKNALNKSESIYVLDSQVLDNTETININTAESAATEKEQAENELCLKSIGQLLIKEMLQKLTLSTVNWINNGNEGGPFFVKNEHGYFESLIRQDILLFNSELDDPALYPFANNLIKSKVRTYQNKFATNAQYSLDKFIYQTTPQFTTEDFKNDFSKGGWNAWMGMTQISANNPLGFYILASDELQKRLDESNSEAKRKLDQNNGFLGDERCANPKGVTRESEIEALKNITKDAKGEIIGLCKKWEYVTPGSIIADWATQKANHQENALLKADDLNAAIASILDAGINKFTNSIQVDGFFGLSDEGTNGSYEIDQDNLLDVGTGTQTEEDFSKFQLNSHWLQDNPDFNIRTDLTQALIDEQRTYKEKIEEQLTVIADLNKTIYQLDFCIPGPHPGWEGDSREALSAAENAIPSKTRADFTDVNVDSIGPIVKTTGALVGLAVGASIGTAVFPGFGTIIGTAIGVIIGFVYDLATVKDTPEYKVDVFYAGIFNQLTGIKLFDKGENIKQTYLRNKSDITNAMDTIFYRYATMMKRYYPPEWLPPVYKDAAREFRKTQGYNEIIKDDNEKIVLLNGVIKRLGYIKDGIDKLNANKKNITEAVYEQELKQYLNEFSSVSQNMVTGDDVALEYNITKQAKEEIKYVYEELLAGPFGCEQWLKTEEHRQHPYFKTLPPEQDKTWWVKNTRRAVYLFPIWYDYNLLKVNEDIPLLPAEVMAKYNITEYPVPNNKMPNIGTDSSGNYIELGSGPGFLSQVFFDYSNYIGSDSQGDHGPCSLRPLADYELDCLIVSDLFPRVDARQVSVGKIISALNWPNFPTEQSDPYYKNEKDSDHPANTVEQLFGIY